MYTTVTLYVECVMSKKVQTIEQTGKGIKAFMLVFALVAIAGGASVAYGLTQPRNVGGPFFAFGLLTFCFGSLGFFAARVVAWWFHG